MNFVCIAPNMPGLLTFILNLLDNVVGMRNVILYGKIKLTMAIDYYLLLNFCGGVAGVKPKTIRINVSASLFSVDAYTFS